MLEKLVTVVDESAEDVEGGLLDCSTRRAGAHGISARPDD